MASAAVVIGALRVNLIRDTKEDVDANSHAEYTVRLSCLAKGMIKFSVRSSVPDKKGQHG